MQPGAYTKGAKHFRIRKIVVCNVRGFQIKAVDSSRVQVMLASEPTWGGRTKNAI